MSSSVRRSSSVFGKRSEPHTVIIASGDRIRHFTIRPWVAALAGSALAAIAIGYLLATSYLVLRDDLLGAAIARQARMQQAYEDRISALRVQVDRITSRQLLDQELMERKVAELLDRQAVLSERHGLLGPLAEESRETPPVPPETAPIPAPRPDLRASADRGEVPGLAFADTHRMAHDQIFSRMFAGRVGGSVDDSIAERADRTFAAIGKSLKTIEMVQIEKVRVMAENAYQTAEEITRALADAGLELDLNEAEPATGGPLIATAPAEFSEEISQLDEAMRMLDEVKSIARNLPFANPVPGARITSSFGMRRDPLLGTRAHHSGMDFRARSGAPIRATGAGTVIAAGWNGGYGRMVEIDHGRGIVTRYAHLSRITVKRGQRVEQGAIIGKAGSSGRSTGPHLHYEVRLRGTPTNPLKFLSAGKKISRFL